MEININKNEIWYCVFLYKLTYSDNLELVDYFCFVFVFFVAIYVFLGV